MCGRATLAMVMSSTTMIIATMLEMVIRPRCLTSTKPPAAARAHCSASFGGYSAAAAEPGPLFEIDRDRGAQSGTERQVDGVVEADADRHALHDFDPVAGGVLRGQQRELRAGAGADAGDLAGEAVVGIGVDGDDRRLLPDLHVGEVGLLEVRLDPAVAGLDDGEHRRRGRDVLADLQPVRLRDDAGARRLDVGVGEVELRLVALGERCLHHRVGLGVDRGISAEGGERRLAPLPGLAQRLLGGVEVVLGRVEIRLGGDALVEEALLAIERLPLEGDVVLRGLLLGHRLLVGGAELLDLEPGAGQRRLGAGKRDAVGLGIDAEQELAGRHRVVLAGRDIDDASRDVGGDRHLVLLDIGVVGRGIAAAGQPEIAADQEQDGGDDRHDDESPPAAGRLLDGGGAGEGFSGSFISTTLGAAPSALMRHSRRIWRELRGFRRPCR